MPLPTHESGGQGSKPQAVWTVAETTAMLKYLQQHKPIGGGFSFEMLVFHGAASHIARLLQDGPAKSGEMCETKWASLRSLYNLIQDYRKTPGAHWDSERGAHIEGVAAKEVWDKYISSNVEYRKPLRTLANKGWPLYDDMYAILGDNACGAHAFYPSLSVAPPIILTDEEASDSSSDTSGLSIPLPRVSARMSLLTGIHSAINRLSDEMVTAREEAVASDLVVITGLATEALQDFDGVTSAERAKMLKVFALNPNAAVVFYRLKRSDHKVDFIHEMLKDK